MVTLKADSHCTQRKVRAMQCNIIHIPSFLIETQITHATQHKDLNKLDFSCHTQGIGQSGKRINISLVQATREGTKYFCACVRCASIEMAILEQDKLLMPFGTSPVFTMLGVMNLRLCL